MENLRKSYLAIAMVSITLQLGSSHKAQFRVLGLQYGTLYQRFELENKLLTEEIEKAKSEIRDLKADNARIIQMFEVFTEEVRELKTTVLEETLKLRSLEAEFKTLHGHHEDLKSDYFANEDQNITETDKVQCSNKTSTSNEIQTKNVIVDKFETDRRDENDIKQVGESFNGESVGSLDVYLFAAKYGDNKACFVNLHKLTVTKCVDHLGGGVRVVTADAERLYWSNDNRKLILSSNFNGSDVRVINEHLTTLGLGVDSLHQVLFYTNISGNIFRKTLTNKNDKGIIWTNIGEKPRRIFVDRQNRFIYAITNNWNGIVRINYFTNERDMIVEEQGRIKSLVVDIRNQILYFNVNSSIYLKYLLDKATFSIFEGSSIPSDLVLHSHYIYIVYYYLHKIDVMDLRTRKITHTVHLPWKGNGNTVSICLVHGDSFM